jgi:hypothetical protein
MDYNMKYTSSYTARSNYGNEDNYGDINKGDTSVDTDIKSEGPEVDFNKEALGNESSELDQETKDMAQEDWLNNPDKWYKDDTYDDSNQGPEKETQDHGEENWDEISAITGASLISGGTYNHGPSSPYKHPFKLPLRRLSRPAEFCGDKFIRWLDNNNPRL